MNPESDSAERNEFVPPADDPLRQVPSVDDMEARRARAAIEGRLFSGPAQPIRVGRYRIEGRIGAGGMGVVYRAHDPELARDVAVKLMHPDAAAGSEERIARARLVREARAMARLAHPNVIHVYDVGTVEDGVFIAMELVDGQSLAAWQAAEPRDWREVLAVCLDAGRGLAAAHAAGVVHRDFKPENVLVGTDGRARVGDFGLAGGAVPATGAHSTTDAHDPATSSTLDDIDGRDVLSGRSGADAENSELDSELGSAEIGGTLTRTGMLLGTPKYMAPEQEIGGSASPRADQFSFCVALYEALYGQSPFAGVTVAEYRRHVHAGQWRAPPSDTKVKAWVHAQVVRGLSADPTARHESMAALIERLEAALSDPSPGRRKRRQRRSMLLAGVGGLGLATSVAVAFAMVPRSETTSPTSIAAGRVQGATASSPLAERRSPPTAAPTLPTADTARGTGLEGVGTGPGTQLGTALGTEGSAPPDAAPAAASGGDLIDAEAKAAPRRKAAKKANDRGYCYFAADTYVHIADRKRAEPYLREAGQCYKCRKGPPDKGYNPSDCRGFRVCHEADDDSQCEG